MFFAFTYPVNVATRFWTIAPMPFEAARRQWEYSHAGAAMLTFAALISIIASVMHFRRHGPEIGALDR